MSSVSFRYYLYISDSKVEMLLAQIDPGSTRRRTAELSLGLRGLGAKRTVESTGGEREERLERVERYLRDHGDLGTLDEPGQFFWGLLPMQWGHVVTGAGASAVYFAGRDERTIVGLGGSVGHVLGAAEQPGQNVLSPSLLPGLLDALDADENTGENDGENVRENTGENAVDRPAAADPDAADRSALSAVHRANSRLRGPTQNVEFIAKRLLSGPSPYPELDGRPGMTVLLGSPLYIAQVD